MLGISILILNRHSGYCFYCCRYPVHDIDLRLKIIEFVESAFLRVSMADYCSFALRHQLHHFQDQRQLPRQHAHSANSAHQSLGNR